jgi:hypothetical protein
MNILKLDVEPLILPGGQTHAQQAIRKLYDDPPLYERLYYQLHSAPPPRYGDEFYAHMQATNTEPLILRWLMSDAEIDAFRSLLPYEDQHRVDEAFVKMLRHRDPTILDGAIPSLRHAVDARTTFVIFQETVQQVQLDFPAWQRERTYLDRGLMPAWRAIWEALVDLALYDIATLTYGQDTNQLELLLHGRSFTALWLYYDVRLTAAGFRLQLHRWVAAVLRERELQEQRMQEITRAARSTL